MKIINAGESLDSLDFDIMFYIKDVSKIFT